jgi:hypothetical protein
MGDTDQFVYDFEVIDHYEISGSLHVIVEERKSGRRYECDGRIGIDRVVEPFSKAYPYGPENEALAIRATEIAETYVNERTPFEMYGGDNWYYTQELRGLSFDERSQIKSLSDEELTELVMQLKAGEIDL